MGFFDRFFAKQIEKQVATQVSSIIESNKNERLKVQASLGLEGSQNLYDVTYGFFDNPYTQIDFTDSWVKFAEYRDIVYQTFMRYNKRAPFGASTVKTVIQFSAAWALKDVTITTDKEDKEHEDFIEYLCKQIKLESFISELATRSELQGHSLVRIITKIDDKGDINFKFVVIPFLRYQYQLKFDEYFEYNGYTYTTKDNKTVTVSKEDSEFFPVYGFTSDYINASFPIPSVGYVLEHCDTIDKGRENMRRTNRLFSRKTPVISTKEQNTATNLLAQIESKDWNDTAFLVAPEITLDKVSADNEGVEAIIKEILSSKQEVSGTCAIPIDKLGYPEQFSAQSVRLENSESINVSAAPKRIAYKTGLESLIAKAATIYNDKMGKSLDPYAFKVTINESAMSLQERKATMLNDMYDRGVIPKKYYLENHPLVGNDAAEILEMVAEEDAIKKQQLDERMTKAIKDMNQEEPSVPMTGEQENEQ